ncbi:MAG: Hsp20 family protein, partial [Bacilli bacterium]|nr:Hsp20 family protein [Bacilli bacterium]
EDNKKYLHRERKMYGKIERTFHIEDMDEDSITAEFKDGILVIIIDKIDENKNKRLIEIK